MPDQPTSEELTARVRELEQTRRTYQALVDNSPDLIYRTDIEGRIIYISKSVERISGYTVEEAIGMKMAEEVYLYPQERQTLLKTLQIEGRVSDFQARLKRKDGSIWWASTNAHFFRDEAGDIAGVEGITRDIGALKEAELALRESENKYRHLFETAMVGIYRTRLSDGKFLAANKTLAEMMGFTSVEEFVEQYIASENYADPVRREELLRLLMVKGRTDGFEIDMLRRDGSIIQVALSSKAYPEQGYLEGVVVDITDRKLAETALKESEERFRVAGQASYDLIYEWNVADDSLVWFGDVDGILGFDKGEISQDIGAWLSLIHEDERHLLEDAVEVHRTSVEPIRYEYRIRHRDGRYRYWADHGLPLLDEDNRPVKWVGVCTDITDRKKAEKEKEELELQLRQSQKMEAVGTLAGGVAHDFNNILGAIMGYGEMAQLAASQGRDNSRELERIVKVTERARDLVKQLLTFSRSSEPDLKPLDVNRLVVSGINLLEHTIPKMIELKKDLKQDLELIQGDAPQLEQIIMNLANNAVDAMPQGGRLTFETDSARLDQRFTEQHLEMTPGKYIIIRVTDTGQGMDKTTLDHIFDPFFTTKEIGKGTGLGLSTVYGIVKEHGGHILCASSPGQGTFFTIYLPALEAETGPAEQPPREPRPTRGGRERILLVDDEEIIRELGQEILEGVGYRVVPAASGEEALEQYAALSGRVDLVLLDLGMPGMGGPKCLAALIALDPRVKVLIASGYSADANVEDLLGQGAKGFIAKPFRRADLLYMIRLVLDS